MRKVQVLVCGGVGNEGMCVAVGGVGFNFLFMCNDFFVTLVAVIRKVDRSS